MLATIEKVLLLQELELFHSSSTEHLAQLAAASREFHLKKHETLLSSDAETVDRLYLLVQGSVRLRRGQDEEGILRCSPLNLRSFFSECGNGLEAQALEACTFLIVSREDLFNLLAAEPELSLAILKYLARRCSEE